MKLTKFKPTKKEIKPWYLKIDKEVSDEFDNFQKINGKLNKTQLVEWLIKQYINQEQYA